MKHIILFLFIASTLSAFGQRPGEVVSDTLYFGFMVNECSDTVYALTETVKLRGGRQFTNTQPVGYSENDPCSGVRYRDSLGLVMAYANPLIDYGRQQATKAKDFIFQNRSLKSFTTINKALENFGHPGIFATVESTFADSLVGAYILVRPGVANANVTVTQTAQGAVRVRLNAQSNLPIVLYSDTWMTLRNVAGANQNVDLYQIEPGRWVSLLSNYQLVKNARQVVSKSIQK